MVSQLTLFVFIIGSQDSCFCVKIESSETVGDLKDSILEKCKNSLKSVNADRLALYQVELPDGETLGALAAQAVKERKELSPSTPLFEIFPTDPPEETISILVNILDVIRDDGTALDVYDGLVDSGLIAYQSIFIKVKSRGNFGDADLDRNCIKKRYSYSWDDDPDHVKKFGQMLDSKPGLDLNEGAWTQVNTKDRSCLATHFRCEETNAGRYAGEGEVKHILLVASFDWENLWLGSMPCRFELKGNLTDFLFFMPLLSPLQPALTNETTNIQLDEKTHFPFIMQRVDIHCEDQLRVRDPRINFVVSKFGLPRLLVEVGSSRYTSWRMVRLLLEGAAIVRFANTFLEAFRGAKNFVLCAVLISRDGVAMRYTLYQKQDHPTVYYKEKQISLYQSIDRIDFVRQLYNLIHMGQEDEYRKDTIMKTSELKRAISAHRLESFSSPDMDTDKFTDYEEADQRDRTGDDEHAADYAELRAHGYEAEPRVIVDDSGGRWEQFYQTPSHIHTVYWSLGPVNKLIAKKTREKSNEVEILKLLNVAKPKSDHIIWLIDSFQGQSNEWAILPKLQSVADTVEYAPEVLKSEVVQVCLDLIKGLAYLHKLCIAHRDIKPDNLLLGRNFCLKIIDFDIAIQVKDEDEEVDDRCGTKGWIAPEIKMKRKVMYSPIKADRWSCGHVLLWILNKLGKDEMPLRGIARKLSAYTPRRRPSLVECCNPSSQLLLDDDNIWDADKRKPSGSRDRQDSMEVDEEDTMPPNAKKQKLL